MIRKYRAWRRRRYVWAYLNKNFVGQGLDAEHLNKFYIRAQNIAFSRWPEPK